MLQSLSFKSALLVYGQLARSVSGKLLSSWLVPACSGTWGYSSPGAQLDIFLGWASGGSCGPISSSCWGPSDWQHNPQMYQPLFSVFHPLEHLWVQSASSMSLLWEFNISEAVSPPGVCHQWVACSWALRCRSQIFEDGSSGNFQSNSLSIYLDHTSSVYLWGCYGRQHQSITKVKINTIYYSPLIHRAIHLPAGWLSMTPTS